jgi:hypothetical protein
VIGSGPGPEVVTRKKRSTINIITGGITVIRPTMTARGLPPAREERGRRRIKRRRKPMKMRLSLLLILLNSPGNRKNNLKSSWMKQVSKILLINIFRETGRRGLKG